MLPFPQTATNHELAVLHQNTTVVSELAKLVLFFIMNDVPFVIDMDIQRRVGLKIEAVDLIYNTKPAPAKHAPKSQL